MKLLLTATVSCLIAAMSVSCASFNDATGFGRAVPVSTASKGTLASLRYRLLTAPSAWQANPLDTVGYSGPIPSSEYHTRNLRAITGNPAYNGYANANSVWGNHPPL